jgi:hypothetical protein
MYQKKMKIRRSDIAQLSEQVAFLILKREWMKVWFRNRYQISKKIRNVQYKNNDTYNSNFLKFFGYFDSIL